MRILLVEDDEVLVGVLLQSLDSQRYVVDAVEDGQAGWEYAQSTNYDLILMDVGLPKLDGITLCKRLRAAGCSTPILLVTAKDASTDRIRGLDAGADDYLLKPLNLEELQARVRALLRRGEVKHTSILQVGKLSLDPSCCQVSYEGVILVLTPKEYNLLELFLRNPSRVFSRGQIVEHLWTFDDPPLEDSVKAHIKGLRQKLKVAGAVDWIENVYGLGYRLSPKVGVSAPQKEDKETPATTPAVELLFNQAMSGMWQQYRGLMVQRLEVLQTAATAVQEGKLSEELRRDAERAAHKLAGVLGMFDREAGTLLAREVEVLLGHEVLLSAQEGKLLSLVQELSNILELAPVLSLLPEAARLLLIDADSSLSGELQKRAHSQGMGWKQVETLELAKIWLQSHAPDLVVLGVDVRHRENSLALLADLVARTPPVPVVVLASTDGLLDRVTVARLGGQGFLVKPVTPTQVWDAATQLLQRNRSQAVNVLVVDDDLVFLTALRPLLEPWGMRMTGLDEPLHFWEVLRSTAPDLLILDVDMPHLSGIELCQAVRTDPYWQGLPILFLTAKSERATIQQVFAAGADDYVTKPIVGPELLTRITNRLERTRLLQTLSNKEPLTGLANQPQSGRSLEYLVQQTAGEDIASPREKCQPFCLVMFIVTEIRQINMQYGHAVGNQVLQRWGSLFQSAFRGNEVLSYWGNGEFVVGLPGLTKAEASDRLSEVLVTLRQQVFTALDGHRFQVSFNFGIAEYPADGTTLQSLYQAVSTLLYKL